MTLWRPMGGPIGTYGPFPDPQDPGTTSTCAPNLSGRLTLSKV